MKTHRFSTHLSAVALGLTAVALVGAPQARSATVWTGPVMTFAETTTDPTQPINQDRMTPNVWITRGPTQGIFNAKTESGFTHFFSPADTRWANGTIANYASLSYTDWNSWAQGVNPSPPSTVGVSAVVHLVSDDIYLGLTFTSWGGSATGLFSYVRTTPSAAVSPIPLSIKQISNKVVVTWTNAAFSLQSATNVTGTYTTITGAASPYTNDLSGARTYFRLIH
jgi:hypothetical protein